MGASSQEPEPMNPYPGLRPFDRGDERLFFGRESQVDRMVDKLAGKRFLAVVGTSGSGKSSLVNCGLRPALHRGLMASAGSAWRVAQFRPGGNPIRSLAKALAAPGTLFTEPPAGGMPVEEVVQATLEMSSLGLQDICEQARLAEGVKLLVVVDQFEELFRYHRLAANPAKGNPADGFAVSAEATAFVKLLLEARACQAIYVVLTMRSDFLGDCAQFEGLAEAINEGQYLVPRLTREERRAAITGPAGVAGGEISPVLLTRLLNDVGDNPDQLSILQHALNRTWAYWQNSSASRGPVDLAHYEAIGTMLNALDGHAEKAYAELGSDFRKQVCEKVFKALTDMGTDARGIRRPTRLSTLSAIASASETEVREVIEVFRKPSRSFLMPPATDALVSESVIDISHESLMRVWKRLREWSEEEAATARMYLRLSETARLHALGEASLWRDPDLSRALDWQRRNAPNAVWAGQYQGDFDASQRFLDESFEAQCRELTQVEMKRRWDTRWGPAILVLVVISFLLSFPTIRQLLDGFEKSHLKDTTAIGAHIDDENRLRALTPILSFLIATAVVIPFILLYWALVFYGRRVYREHAYPRILRRFVAAGGHELTETPLPEAVGAQDTSYAGAWRRVIGYGIDLLLFFLLFFVASFIAIGFDPKVHEPGPEVTPRTTYIIWSAYFILGWLYHSLTVASKKQATPGMRVMRTFLTDRYGRRVTLARASARYFASFLSWYTVGIGFLMQLFTTKRQTLHDRLAGTVVLRRKRAATSAGGPAPVRHPGEDRPPLPPAGAGNIPESPAVIPL